LHFWGYLPKHYPNIRDGQLLTAAREDVI
jgi:hypothetical protein